MGNHKPELLEETYNEEVADYRTLYHSVMNELNKIADAAIASQRKIEEMFLKQTDPV